MSSFLHLFHRSRRLAQLFSFLVVGVFCISAAQLFARTSTIIRINASAAYQEPEPAPYDEGASISPAGNVLGVNRLYLTRNGKPWLPVMGEFHFSRYPRAQWEEELLKMKTAGVEVVATYIIWIHHEEVRGEFDWSGQRDLRAFAQLCAKHGLYLEVRIGPWDHAEARNGGLPDWVLRQGPTRVNDPAYLAAVRNWYAAIGQQLRGLLWKDGGPVIGVQLENEYAKRGAGAGEAHILMLRKLALESGLDVPLYVVTGWDNAVVPARAVIPVYGGGYPDAPWDGSLTELPPAEVYAFRFKSRVSVNMGAISVSGIAGKPITAQDSMPYLTAEIGGGIEDTYHRRPVIHADDIAAMVPVMIGSGVNLYGTYMFQGGENPDGKLTTLQESQATGYPTDVPVKSYDFQAPLGEFGEERASLRKLKVYQYFLNSFGEKLAPMIVRAPQIRPRNSQDLSVPRASVRSLGESGFIFLNNYVRNYILPMRPAIQFQIRLPGGTLRVPRKPVDIPSGAYFIWPFNLQEQGVTLRYSTAQLFTRLTGADGPTLYFAAVPGIPSEFAFAAKGVRELKTSSGTVVQQAGVKYVRGLKPGPDSFLDVLTADGRHLRIVLLSAQQAENTWKVRLAGAEHLLITAADFFADDQGVSEHIWLRSRGVPHFAFAVTPRLSVPLHAIPSLQQVGGTERVSRFTATAVEHNISLRVEQTHPAGFAPPAKIGPAPEWRSYGVAEAPADSAFAQAAQWRVTVPSNALAGLSELFLNVEYEGDIARLSSHGKLLIDNFFNGQPWSIGLKRFMNGHVEAHFDLAVLPLRKDAPVYLELPHPIDFSAAGQVARLDQIRLVLEYELSIETTAH